MTVKTWRKDVLQADSMSVGVCESGDTIGLDFHATDGRVFAHGHLDFEMALMLNQQLLQAIEQLKRRAN